MADIHVEEFYKDVAVALVQLYSVFPRRTNLFVEDIAGPDEPDEFVTEEDFEAMTSEG